MITQKDAQEILEEYDLDNITIGVLGGHSALDVCHGAKKYGFKTLAVCQKGREKTYTKYFKTCGKKGCIDDIILLDKFRDRDVVKVQKELRERNTIFIHNRYFWVYCDFNEIENDFRVPIFGTRTLRGYERAFFYAASPEDYLKKSNELLKKGSITKEDLEKAVIEEYVVGAPVNFNYFYSVIDDELELWIIEASGK